MAGLPRPVIQVPRHGRRHGSLASSIQALCCKPPERPPGRDPRKGDGLHGRQVPPPPRAASTDWAPTSPTLTPEMPRCYVVYVGRVPGVYEEWKDCQKQVNNFSGNSYQGYESREVAEEKWRRHRRKKWGNFLVITTLLLFMVGYVFYFI